MTKRPDIMSTSDDAAASKRQEKKQEALEDYYMNLKNRGKLAC